MFCLAHLNAVRAAEIEIIASHLRPGARSEIGAGTGQRARFSRRGFDVAAIEILHPTTQGTHLPDRRLRRARDSVRGCLVRYRILVQCPRACPGSRSNEPEIRRILKLDGICIHAMPTHAWRFWTSVSAFPDALQHAFALRHKLLPQAGSWRASARAWLQVARLLAGAVFQPRHGERGNAATELWRCSPRWWRRSFRENGFEVLHDAPMGLFYTGTWCSA